MDMWFGADWDSEKCVVAFEKGGRLHRRHVKRNPDAVARFLAEFEGTRARVGIESGDRLWPRLWRGAGAEVLVFDGKKTRRFGESLCASGARDDKRAAEDLLAMVRSPSHQAQSNNEASGEVLALQRLLTLADLAAKEVVRCENRLRSHLSQVHPALALAMKDSLKTAWFLRALELAPTPSAWNECDGEARLKALKGSAKKSRPAFAVAFGEDWNAIDEAEEDAIRLHVRHLASVLDDALRRQRRVQKSLAEATGASATSATTEPLDGIGPYLGGAIAIGFACADGANRDSLALQLGAAPVTTRSGTTGDRRPNVRMRRAVSSPMKKAAHLMGFQLVGHYRWAHAQYAFYRARGISGPGAYRRITRSFSRILTALHRDKTLFDEARYITGLKRRGVTWAMDLET